MSIETQQRWTIYVCDECDRVHDRPGVCRRWAEHERGGSLRCIEVVPAPPRDPFTRCTWCGRRIPRTPPHEGVPVCDCGGRPSVWEAPEE